MVSEKNSFQGWNFLEWLKGNKDLLEQAAKLLPGIITWIQTQNPAWTFAVVLVGKLVLDAIHYFVKEY